MTVREIVFLVPDGIDDPVRVSGGNVYDRHVRDGLDAHGWRVRTAAVKGAGDTAAALGGLPRGATVLVDGLVGLCAVEALVEAASRLRILVLAHMVAAAFPDAGAGTVAAERQLFATAHGVIVTSRWTAAELGRRALAGPEHVTVAVPGVEVGPLESAQHDEAEAEDPSRDGRLLCVGVVAPHKGQDILLDALARLTRSDWTCTIAGASAASGDFADAIRHDAQRFEGRVRLAGVLGGAELAGEYRRSALLVAPSRVESSGMAIAEALGRGIPVVAAATGGIPDTVAGGGAALVPPDDPAALAAALSAWLDDPALRRRLRAEARSARAGLPTWADTVRAVAGALEAS
ncbi:glycosyltransferase family 4 protein [Microbacterium sp. 22242]|uniref:glycosyltransferase family 4 protein n=1 Tax=Microbacterium sp. 22242 TaxID=3453896 RepID=UPI003F85F741